MSQSQDPFGTAPGPHGAELVTVLKSNDPSLVLIAESILRSAEMEFLTLGGMGENLWGSPAGIPAITQQLELQVRSDDAADARALLADLEAHAEDESWALDEDDDSWDVNADDDDGGTEDDES